MGKILRLFIVITGSIIFLSACGNGNKASDTKEWNATDISEITINNTSWNLKILASSDEKIHVSYEGAVKGKNSGVRVEQQDSVLSITQTEEQKGAEQQFSFGKSGEIFLYLPKEISFPAHIEIGSGEMQIEGVSFTEFSLKDSSGYVTLSDMTAEKTSILSSSGDIIIENSILPNSEIKTTSAYVTIKNTDINVTTIITGSGEVGLSSIKDYTDLSIQTGSGDISVSHKEAPANLSFDISTGSSDITAHLKNVDYTTNTNSCKQGEIGAGDSHLAILSDTGTISVK